MLRDPCGMRFVKQSSAVLFIVLTKEGWLVVSDMFRQLEGLSKGL